MKITVENVDAVVARVYADPAASYWLKNMLRAALDRDPVDAKLDADVLQAILKVRCQIMLGDEVAL